MQAQLTKLRPSLFYIAFINDRKVNCMLDTGVTHNFVATRVILRLGAKLLDEPHFIKTVNAFPNATNELVRVPIQMEN